MSNDITMSYVQHTHHKKTMHQITKEKYMYRRIQKKLERALTFDFLQSRV